MVGFDFLTFKLTFVFLVEFFCKVLDVILAVCGNIHIGGVKDFINCLCALCRLRRGGNLRNKLRRHFVGFGLPALLLQKANSRSGKNAVVLCVFRFTVNDFLPIFYRIFKPVSFKVIFCFGYAFNVRIDSMSKLVYVLYHVVEGFRRADGRRRNALNSFRNFLLSVV